MSPYISPISAAHSSSRGPLLCVLSAVSGGFAAVFAVHSESSGLSVSSMLTFRFSIATVILWTLVAVRRPVLPSMTVMLKLAVLGAIGFGLEGAFFFSALQKINAATADMLLFVYPTIVVVMGVLMRREHFGPRKALALGSSIAGLALLMGSGVLGGTLAASGVVLALAAAVSYAIYVVAAGDMLADIDGYVAAALVTTGATLSMGAGSIAIGSFSFPHAASAWVWVILLALVSTVLLNVLFLAGVRHIGASKAVLFSCIEPVVTAITTAVAFGNAIGVTQILGGALVIASIAPLQIPARRLVVLFGRAPLAEPRLTIYEEAA